MTSVTMVSVHVSVHVSVCMYDIDAHIQCYITANDKIFINLYGQQMIAKKLGILFTIDLILKATYDGWPCAHNYFGGLLWCYCF